MIMKMSDKTSRRRFFVLVYILSGMILGCDSFVDVDAPPVQISTDNVYNNDEAAASAIRGIYSEMISGTSLASGGGSSVTVLAGRSSDEFDNYSTGFSGAFSVNQLTADNTTVKTGLWSPAYKYIYYANSALQGLAESTTVNDTLKQQLIGEAKFTRAFCYFYLVNLFGKVPIIESTDYRVNMVAHKASIDNIYKFIIQDLTEASDLLADNFSFANQERTRPNKWVANSLLSRVYLYRQEWSKAEEYATSVIESGLFSLQNDLNKVFLKNSSEAIWQLVPPTGTFNTREGNGLILTSAPSSVALSENLLDSFEDGDLRRTAWVSSITANSITYFFPFKYKVRTGATITEYSMVFRLAEQYLIRAEARAHLSNLSEAISDLDKIRSRADLPLVEEAYPEIDSDGLIQLVLDERQTELFTEWGHRWFDLKRTDMANNILGPIKGDTWTTDDQLYPIPQSEINNNLNLLPQNPGYN